MAEAVVTIAMRAQTAALKKGFRDVNNAIGTTNKRVVDLGRTFKRSFTEIRAAVDLVSRGFRQLFSAFGSLDEIAKTARGLNLTVGELRALRLEGTKVGGNVSGINRLMQDFQRNIGDAARGTGEAREQLEKMGLSATRLARTNLFEAMRQVSQSINDLGTESERQAVRQRIFGRATRDNVLVLRDLSEILDKVQARSSGLDFNTKAVEDAVDAWTELKTAIQTTFAELVDAVTVSPGEGGASAQESAQTGLLGGLLGFGTASQLDNNQKAFNKAKDALKDYQEQIEQLQTNKGLQGAAQGVTSVTTELELQAAAAKKAQEELKKFMSQPLNFLDIQQADTRSFIQNFVSQMTGGLTGASGVNPGTARRGGFSSFRRGQEEMRRQTSILEAIRTATELSAQLQAQGRAVGLLGSLSGAL